MSTKPHHQNRILCEILIILALACILAACQSAATPTANTPAVAPVTFSPPDPNSDLYKQIDAIVKPLYDQGVFSGNIVVAQGDKLLYSNSYGYQDYANKTPISANTQFPIASISKMFTAMGIMMLQEQGKLNVQNKLCQYITDCPGEWKDITLHHLLSHNAGFGDFQDVDLQDQNSWIYQPSTPEKLVERIKGTPLVGSPGSGFYYSDMDYILLGYVLEKVSGMTYGDFLQKNIFTPLGMQNTGYLGKPQNLATGYSTLWEETPPIDLSNQFAAGGLHTTSEDLAKWSSAAMNSKLVSPETSKLIFSPQNTIEGDIAYGYGWFLMNVDGHPEAGHAGYVPGFYQNFATFPNDQLAIVWLTNNEPSIDVFEPMKDIARLVFNQ